MGTHTYGGASAPGEYRDEMYGERGIVREREGFQKGLFIKDPCKVLFYQLNSLQYLLVTDHNRQGPFIYVIYAGKNTETVLF